MWRDTMRRRCGGWTTTRSGSRSRRQLRKPGFQSVLYNGNAKRERFAKRTGISLGGNPYRFSILDRLSRGSKIRAMDPISTHAALQIAFVAADNLGTAMTEKLHAIRASGAAPLSLDQRFLLERAYAVFREYCFYYGALMLAFGSGSSRSQRAKPCWSAYGASMWSWPRSSA
jgi:hypothetical protein